MPDREVTSRGSAAQRPARTIGRPRDPTRDAAIRAAALRVLADVGYHDFTMDAVAVTAGVGKATIYRRWAGRRELLMDVIQSLGAKRLDEPDTGSLRDDLIALLGSLIESLAGPDGAANRTLLYVLIDDSVLAEAYRAGPPQRWAEAVTTTVDRAVARGDVPPGAGSSLGLEAGPAILIRRWLLGEQPVDATAVVDGVMLPLLACSRRTP